MPDDVRDGLAVAAMLAFFGRTAQRHPLLPVALGLVIGGSISNLIDRVRLKTLYLGIVLALGIPSMTVRTAIMVPIAWALVGALGLERRSRGSARMSRRLQLLVGLFLRTLS